MGLLCTPILKKGWKKGYVIIRPLTNVSLCNLEIQYNQANKEHLTFSKYRPLLKGLMLSKESLRKCIGTILLGLLTSKERKEKRVNGNKT